ncbi:UPF0454 protein C12orf49-like [Leptonychotes weddellii]|uniref:UPF0454 protein C12orf49-like n=1 Tax=Leptonychotes weddellii TaxID=9713 RepID=A0A7F8QAE6_LEPWE|nr:UPF0454 protein C12orf49-like [Leptonychotes weddellii]
MVNLAAMVWRRLLRKRWVLALVFGLSLVYFLSSTFKQTSECCSEPGLNLCILSYLTQVISGTIVYFQLYALDTQICN